LENGKGKTNANPAEKTMVHHDVRFFVLCGGTTHTFVLVYRDHLVSVGRIYIIFCHDSTPGTSMGRIDTEAGPPIVFNNFKIFLSVEGISKTPSST
jgi:hypothetical protein